MKKLLLLALFVLLGSAADAKAATRTVCASGCDYTNLNSALAAASGGDVITLAVGETFQQCSVLPNKGNQTPITIRSAASNGNLPGTGVRFDPNNATWAANVANLTGCVGGAPALKADVGAQDYVIGPGLHFVSNPGGYGVMIELGNNTTNQQFVADQPKEITVDRNWLDGDPIIGQKIGIDLNGATLIVTNNYINRIAAVSQDATAVRCINGTGPYTIENNYIVGSAEGFLCGGDSPQMYTYAAVTAATTSTATLATFRSGHDVTTLKVGQLIAVLTGGGATRRHTTVTSCGTSTLGASCSSNNITFTALPVVPDIGTGSDIRWGVIPDVITFRRNHVYKPLTWKNPILDQVPTVVPTSSTANGSLPAGTYNYRVVAVATGYNYNNIYGTGSIEIIATLAGTGKITLNWTAVTNATKYRVFRSQTSGSYAGYIEVLTNSAVDTGQALTGTSALPTPSKWVIKNLMEIKFGTHYQIDSNVFENAWAGSDIGYAIWLKSNNANGIADYAKTRYVTFEKNIIKNVFGCFSILGRIDASPSDWSDYIEDMTLRQNVCYDSFASNSVGTGTVYAIKVQSPVKNLTIEQNTFIHTMRGFLYLVKTGTQLFENLTVNNNLGSKETYGVFGSSCVSGTECLFEATTAYSFRGNVLCGASAADYPTSNLYPTCTEFTGSNNFTDYANDDYSLKSTSTWKGTGVGGVDPGANIALITSATTGVTSGAAESTTPPNITTTTLPNGTQNSAYSQSLSVTGGTSTYTWVVLSGTLPTGLSLSTNTISGTPTVPGTSNFTVRVTDSTSPTTLTDTQALSITIAPASSTLAVVTTSPLTSGQVSLPYSISFAASGGTPPYSWDVSSGSLPTWATLTPDGVVTGTPDVAATTTFTGRVTDAASGTATRSFSLVIAAEVKNCPARQQRVNFQGLVIEGSFFRRPIPPISSTPDCAQKNDLWSDTVTNRLYYASANDPLTWSFASQVSHNLMGPTHADTVDGTPQPGDIIMANDDGNWTIASPDMLQFDASAITTGTINPARLPRIPQTITIRADATDFSMGASASFTEITTSQLHRGQWDLTNVVQMRVVVMQTAVAVTTPTVVVQYSTDQSSWSSSGVFVTLGTVANKVMTGDWIDIPAAMKDDIYLRIGTQGGNGTESPDIANIYLQIKQATRMADLSFTHAAAGPTLAVDPADPTAIGTSEWRAAHSVSGGTTGQLVKRSATGVDCTADPSVNTLVFPLTAPSSPANGSFWVTDDGTDVTIWIKRSNGTLVSIVITP